MVVLWEIFMNILQKPEIFPILTEITIASTSGISEILQGGSNIFSRSMLSDSP